MTKHSFRTARPSPCQTGFTGLATVGTPPAVLKRAASRRVSFPLTPRLGDQPIFIKIPNQMGDSDRTPSPSPERTPPPGQKGIKRPRHVDLSCYEMLDDEEGPDLEAYLDTFTTSDKTNIQLLRSYANYLASKLKAQGEQK